MAGISPFGVSLDARPHALFFAHDSFGLGHIRRSLALAGEVARRRPDVAMLLLTSSFLGGAWQTPENLDLIKLPSLSRTAVYADEGYRQRTHPERQGQPRGTTAGTFHTLREQMIHDVATLFGPWLFVADNEPVGLTASRELVRTLRDLRSSPTGTQTIAGLRDIYDEPAWTRTAWQRFGISDALERLYDRILIYGDPVVFDAVAEFGLPPSIADKIVYTGYIRKQEPVRPTAEVRADLGAEDRPLVIVTNGGGGAGDDLVRAYLQALAAGALGEVSSLIVTGPLMSERERAAAAAAGKRPHTRVIAFDPDHLSSLHAADVIVSRAGYNTVTEALSFGKRLIVVPQERPGEQRIRAERMAALGLLHLLPLDRLTPDRLARSVQAALAGPPPEVNLDFGGLERAGEIMAEALV
ncbi:MAG: hypothetical protein DCC58_16670 [Chloroflexi bacterium]|nr:MAG: hypothetical protein DCC58_16670 [Chloroflexota bacterium]